MVFRSSRSTADLLTVVSARTARAFNRFGATRAVALDIFKAFDRVWHVQAVHSSFFFIFGRNFHFLSFFDHNLTILYFANRNTWSIF